MSPPPLAAAICAQIVVFQLFPIPLTRSLFRARLDTPPPSVDAELRRYVHDSSRSRSLLGAILLVVALGGGLLGLGPTVAGPKILLAVVSLTSSAAFLAATVRDRRVLHSLLGRLPEASRRIASLERRHLSRWYRPAWEVLPIVVLVVTGTLAALAGLRSGALPPRTWLLLALQAAFVLGGLLYVLQRAPAVTPVPQRPVSVRDRPEAALRVGEDLLAREMRYFVAARIGVALLLGTSVAEDALGALRHPAAPVAGAATWGLVGVLLLAFARYLRDVLRATRRALGPVPEEKCHP